MYKYISIYARDTHYVSKFNSQEFWSLSPTSASSSPRQQQLEVSLHCQRIASQSISKQPEQGGSRVNWRCSFRREMDAHPGEQLDFNGPHEGRRVHLPTDDGAAVAPAGSAREHQRPKAFGCAIARHFRRGSRPVCWPVLGGCVYHLLHKHAHLEVEFLH